MSDEEVHNKKVAAKKATKPKKKAKREIVKEPSPELESELESEFEDAKSESEEESEVESAVESEVESEEEEKKKGKKVIKKKAKVKATKEDSDEDDQTEQVEEVYDLDSYVKSKLVIPRPKGSPFADAISPDALEFLANLAENNDRDFMHLRVKEWTAVRKDFTDFCGLLMKDIYEFDPTIRLEEPKNAVYRQNRDLRFSNDKRPYKTNLSAAFSGTGKKFLNAGYFLSIRPGNESMIAAGVWQPGKEMLASIRDNIIRNGDLLKEAISTDAIIDIFDGKSGIEILEDSDKLKNGPKGIEKDHPEIELLKFRSFAICKKFTDEEIVSPGFADKVLDVVEALVPFTAVINSWI